MLRKYQVLKAIVKEFVETGLPVGSETVLVSYKFSVSPATIRNDMSELEEERMIFQPHTSSGRVPTSGGYRRYLTDLADFEEAHNRALKTLTKIQKGYEIERAREKLYDAVSLLARAADTVSFATIPDNERTFYLGTAYAFRKPEFLQDPLRASQVMEVFERNDRFLNILRTLKIQKSPPQVFIGEENMFPQFKSCSMIVTPYEFRGAKGFLGLLGSTRMDYPYAMALVEEIKKLLKQ